MNTNDSKHVVDEIEKLHYKGVSDKNISDKLKVPEKIVKLVIMFNCN